MPDALKQIVAADIGGTNSRFALFSVSGAGQLKLEHKQTIDSASVPSFDALLEKLEHEEFPIRLTDADAVALAAAGPVERGMFCAPTNITWSIDLWSSMPKFGVKLCRLLNDFTAQAYAVVSPIGSEAIPVLKGEAVADATIGVIGAGTGLGKAYLVPDAKWGYLSCPSEGGHSAYAPETEVEFELRKFAMQHLGGPAYVSWEHLLCGRGLSLIHEFCCGEALAPREVAAKLNSAEKTLQLYAVIAGQACRNFVFETWSLGGMYISGGVIAKNPQLVQNEFFRAGFYRTTVHQRLIEKTTVYLIDNQDAGLWGSAYYGQYLLTH